ncbi:MAG: radical SAM protein [Candidatus Lokiarchaeota archaeon]|nr:radical SAM protein [Candidatus Lokiarchaeota archaeon]
MKLQQSQNIRPTLSLNNKVLQKYSQYIGLGLSQTHKAVQLFDFSVTKYYQNLIDSLILQGKESDAKRIINSILPQNLEADIHSDIEDGIGEETTADNNSILSKLFLNRILLSINNRCPVYCRYCFRRRRLGKKSAHISEFQIVEAIEYIKKLIEESKNKNEVFIDEIILSGGEPLSISYKLLKKIVEEINTIKEIKTCRVDTKLLAVNPNKFDLRLIKLLSSLKTTYVINHFIHPEEITDIVVEKINKLLKYGIVTGAHIPIIKGVNDEYEIIKKLINTLYQNRVKPYYLIHFIPTKWTEHFRIPLERSIEIKERLTKECSGFSLPSLIVYLPKAKGKAIINSKRDIRRVEGGFILTNTMNEEVYFEEKI